jgi:AraC family transcriptional regulator
MMGRDELRLAQKDGGPPTTLVAGSAPGESGVSVLRVRFRGGAHFNVIARQHLVCFVSRVRVECRIAGRTFRHDTPAGSLAICPAGIDSVAHADAKQGTLCTREL